LFKFVLLFKKNYFSGELFLVLEIIGGLFEPNKREKNTKKKLFEDEDFLNTSFVRNLNSF